MLQFIETIWAMMKNKIFSTQDGCVFKNRKMLFDTNVWIYINEIGASPELAEKYSCYYRKL
jgi:hypothetical protein